MQQYTRDGVSSACESPTRVVDAKQPNGQNLQPGLHRQDRPASNGDDPLSRSCARSSRQPASGLPCMLKFQLSPSCSFLVLPDQSWRPALSLFGGQMSASLHSVLCNARSEPQNRTVSCGFRRITSRADVRPNAVHELGASACPGA